MKPNRIILGVMLSLTGANAFAQSADQAALQSQLAELKKMVEIQNKKIAELETAITQKNSGVSPETQANLNALNAKVSSMDKKLDQSGKFSPKETKFVEKLTFNGRIQPQFDWLTNETTLANGSKVHNASDNQRFFLRRLYFGVEADLGNGFMGNATMNFASNPGGGSTIDPDMEKAFVAYKFKALEDKDQMVSFGYQKVPFGIEETTSSSKIKSVERSLANRFWGEGGTGLTVNNRHTGLFLSGDLPAGFAYSTAIANPDGGENDSAAPNTNKPGFYGRLQNKGEILSGAFAGKYLIGADLAWQSDVATRAPVINDSSITAYGVHANYTTKIVDRDFGITTEFITGNVENALGVGKDASPISWMIEPTYFIDLDKKWEVVFRYTFLDTDGKGYNIRDGVRRAPNSGFLFDTFNSYYLGMNYYFKGDAFKITAGYEFATGEDQVGGVAAKKDEASGIRIRAQLMF